MGRHVTAIYHDFQDARDAVDGLLASGFARNRISIVANEQVREEHFPETVEGTSTAGGVAAGSAIGAIAGGFIALASLALPGGVFVAGPLGAFLGGAATGLAGGGLLGALVGAGLPEEEAHAYQESIQRGDILIGVDAPDDPSASTAARILQEAGARRAPTTWSAPARTL